MSAVLVVSLTVAIASIWQPDRSVEQLAGRWAPAPSKFLPLDGMSVHYRDEGPRDAATPVVLLHGTSASLHTWQGWTSTLAAEHRVVRMDLPGFGLTGPFADGDYTMAHTVRFLERFLAGSVLVSLPGLGHVPHEEDPQASLAAAASFLARQGAVLSDRASSP